MKANVSSDDFYVRFWGVRGSLSVSGPDTIRYGGNTSCLEIRCGDRLLMFDAGSGLRYLGNELVAAGKPLDADLFLTHVHYDHVCGIPFFTPFYMPGHKFRIWSGDLEPYLETKEVFQALMSPPLFPVPPAVFQAELDYRPFKTGDVLSPCADIQVRTANLNHPNAATGYRVDYRGKSICYLTDTEHPAEGVDETIVDLIRGADIAIYDSMYSDEEYSGCAGYGHSTWNAGLALAEAAGVKTFIAFHHEPGHADDFMDDVQVHLEQVRPGSLVAMEGMVVQP